MNRESRQPPNSHSLAYADQRGGARYGGWVTESSSTAVAAYVDAGFDFVCIDCQHSEVAESDAATMLRTGPHPGVPVLVRVSDNRSSLIGRVLDAGADGVIVPDVNSVEDAERAVAATRYPPAGHRSFGPTNSDLPRDPAELEARALCLVMIETADALERVEEICAVPGLGGVLVGPGDLSLALGLRLDGAFSTSQLDPAMARIGDACSAHGVTFGSYATDQDSASRWRGLGVDLIPVGSSTRLLRAAASDLRRALIPDDLA